MKHGKRLRRRHKDLLRYDGHIPKDFLYTKDTPEYVEFVERNTGKVLTIRK